MEYTKKDLGSFNLHLIKTDKFKTITVRVIFHTPIKKEDITKRGVLSDMLLQSSKKYDSRRNLTIQAEELYAVDIATNNQRVGNYIFTSFNMEVLQDKYTEDGNFEKSLDFFHEILFNPDVKNGSFKKDKLDIVKNNTSVAIKYIKEDSSNYSLIRMMEAFDKDSPVSYRMSGYIEDLEKINEINLYDTYNNMIDNDFVDIFVVGNFDDLEMLNLIKKYFKFKKVKKQKDEYYLECKKARKRRLFAKEINENSQSKLAIACTLQRLTPFERDYSLVLANLIFGGGTDSKLFREVREKNSLCYTIHSVTNKLDNVLIIRAGIDKDNFNKTVDLITENLKDMQRGRFSSKDIEIAKEFYTTSLEEYAESENRIINEYIGISILGFDKVEDRLAKIKRVRKQDIVKVCKKITMDTVFLLEGDNNEED